MKERYSPKQTAAMKAHLRRLRAQQRRRMTAAIIIFFILGVVAGIFAYRWFNGRSGKDITGEAAPVTVKPAEETATPEPEFTPEPELTPEAWAMPEEGAEDGGIFLRQEETSQADNRAEQDAFPEVEAESEADVDEEAFAENAEEAGEQAEVVTNAAVEPENAQEPEAGENAEGEEQPAPEQSAESSEEAGAEQGNVAPGQPLVVQAETTKAPEAPSEQAPEESAPEQAAAPEEGEAAPEESAPEQEAAPEEGEAAPEESAPEQEAAPEEGEAAPEENAPEQEAAPEEGDAAPEESAPEQEAAPEEGEAAPEESAPEQEAAPEEGEAAPGENAPEQEAAPEEGEAAPEESAEEESPSLASYGPQVVAIVPYGESFTYMTEIDANGNARLEAGDEPYETVSFTQTMKSYMRPTDFANKYSTQYKLQGDEAGAGFELILNDYTGETTIIPQNVVDISLRSESGNTVERGYQLMDAEIAGNYGIALTTNTPKMLYKRYQYSDSGEEMAYLVVTTYKDGQTQMILFQLESDEPEPEPEVVYNILQRGIKSDEVLAMQNRLIELGYLTGTVDGSFGPKTEEAIKAAQAAFGMEQTGIADSAFQQKLFEGAAPTVGQAAGYVTLSDGSVGDAVKRLQSRLKELGYYDGRIDGGYGPMMVAAVKKAQAAFGMEQTGIADSAFQERVFAGTETQASAAAATAAPSDGVTLSNGSTGDAVVKLQVSLREQGFYSGRADGGYGPNTVAAVKAAQAAFGMEQTGVADAAFQQRLFGGDAAPAQNEATEEAADAGEAAEAQQSSEAAENTVG